MPDHTSSPQGRRSLSGFQPTAAPAINDTIILWSTAFLEGCLWVNKRFRFAGDQDESLLYLAAWLFLANDLLRQRDFDDVLNLSPADGLVQVLPDHFPHSHINAFVEETGIPRETARRKLAALVRRGTLVNFGDHTFQLAASDDQPLHLLQPIRALARWLLFCNGHGADHQVETRTLRDFLLLARPYLSAYIALVKSRRLYTGSISHVPVQLGLQVLHNYRVQRQLTLEGPPLRWNLATFIELSGRLFEEASYVRQVAQLCEVSPQQVRKSCLKLAEKNDQVRLADGDVILGGPGYAKEKLGSRRFYTAEAQHWLTAFTLRVLAGRLPAGDRPGAP